MGRRLPPAPILVALLALAAPAARSGGEGEEAKEAPAPADLLRRADEAVYIFADSGTALLQGRMVIPGTSLGRLAVDFTWRAPKEARAAATLRVAAAEEVPAAYRPLAEKQATTVLESLVIGRPFALLAGEARLEAEMKEGRPLLRVRYTSGPLEGRRGTLTFDPETGLPLTQVVEMGPGATLTDTFRFEKRERTHRLAAIERRTRDAEGREHAQETTVEWVEVKGLSLPWRIRNRGQLVGAGEFRLERILLDGTRVVTPEELEEAGK